MIRRVLITGAAGFCAKHLVLRLRSAGEMYIFGSDLCEAVSGQSDYDQYLTADITDRAEVAELVRQVRPDWIFHLAGMVAGDDVSQIYRVNFSGTINLLDAYHRFAPREASLLLVGSAAEYGSVDTDLLPVVETQVCNPTGSYGISKYAVTMAGLDFARRYDRKVVVVRPFNIIGAGIPPTLVLGAVLQRIHEAFASSGNAVIRVGNTSSMRDFIAVEDVADAYVRVMEGEHWGEIFNICSGEPRSIQSLLDQLVQHSPRPVIFQQDKELMRKSDLSSFYGSNEKARAAFGFVPRVSVEVALASAWKNVMEGK